MKNKINTKRLIDIFLRLVKIDSPSGEEREMAFYIYNNLKKIFPNTEIDGNNNIIIRIDNKQKKWIFLNAHLDTVEPGRNINPVIHNGVIQSKGNTILGADNKASIAAIIEVLLMIFENKLSTNNLEIVFTTSEETENLGAHKLNYARIKSKKGFVFDTASPIGHIVLAQPYYYNFDIEIIGKSSHACYPEAGKNVLPIFAEIISKIKLGRISEKTTVNIGHINGGYARNSIPEKITINGELRSFDLEEAKNNISFLKSNFYRHVTKNSFKGNFQEKLENLGYSHNPNDYLINKTKKKLRKININPILVNTMSCSDANIFNNNGLKILNMGNGVSYPHTTRESIKTKGLFKLTELILELTSI